MKRTPVQGYLTEENRDKFEEIRAALKAELGIDSDSAIINMMTVAFWIQRFDGDSKSKRLQRIETKIDELMGG